MLIGGDQIDYVDETAEVRSQFAEALSEHGLEPQMDDAYKAELADLPPKQAACSGSSIVGLPRPWPGRRRGVRD